MGWLGIVGRLLGGSKGVSAIDAVTNIIERHYDRQTDRALIAGKLAGKAAEVEGEIAKVELQSDDPWTRRAIPFVHWTIGTALWLYLVPHHALTAWYWSRAVIGAGELVPYPQIGNHLMHLVIGMLGLTAMHLVKQLAGKAR